MPLRPPPAAEAPVARRAAAVFPRLALAALAALLIATVLAATAVRHSGVAIAAPDAPALAIRSLRFEDAADGSVAVIDARDGALVRRIEGQQGFVRGALRALARERRRAGIGPQAPFQLIGRADGRLTLFDPATGHRIDLESFGPTNAAEFAQLLADAGRPER
jgi:putative photosynthetic complex assembly protein